MTDYETRALLLGVEDSEFLWALILDMAKTIDKMMVDLYETKSKED